MRSIRFRLVWCLLCLFLWTTFAALSYDDFVVQFTNASANLSIAQKKTYYLQVYNNLCLLAIRNRDDAAQLNLYNSLKTYVQGQLKVLWTGGSSSPAFSITAVWSDMNIPKVNLAKVRDVRLWLHNAERSTKKLTPFTYNPSLEKTATTWAKRLADFGKATHKRAYTDGYYSYTSIKQRFINQWIIFANKEQNGQALFSESLGWNMYSCKKADCTDDFIKAIKKSRSFFMSEKPSGPHYNAIVGKFTNIGLGVVVSGNKYYLVTHYTQDLK